MSYNGHVVDKYKIRRIIIVLLSLAFLAFVILINTPINTIKKPPIKPSTQNIVSSPAIDALKKLVIKGRAPKTNYSREQFGVSWTVNNGCDTRNIILNRDLSQPIVDENCNVISGILNDPYTGKIIQFKRGSDTSSEVQIDHVVALSDAWQKGAQQFTLEKRQQLANDSLELLAVSGVANLQKSDGDAATWLPSNKSFRCSYVSRQVAVKLKYNLWVTQAEYNAIESILNNCPKQLLPNP